MMLKLLATMGEACKLAGLTIVTMATPGAVSVVIAELLGEWRYAAVGLFFVPLAGMYQKKVSPKMMSALYGRILFYVPSISAPLYVVLWNSDPQVRGYLAIFISVSAFTLHILEYCLGYREVSRDG